MTFIKSFKNQSWLFPPSIEELIPEDHVCFLVESFVESLDYSIFEKNCDGAGHPSYHPRVILKLLVMGVLDRIRSSRNVARNARENIVYMYLAEKLAPDFRTISDFRKNNPELIKVAFKHTVNLAKNEGMLDLSHFSTDGTKIKANASNKRIFTKEELTFLNDFIDNELEKWAKHDSLEDDFFEEIRGSDQLPKTSKKRVRAAVKHYIEELGEKGDLFKEDLKKKFENAQHAVEKNDLKKVSMTDPESRFMRSKNGIIELSYNPQITTESNGFILANDVCDSSSDIHQLQPLVLQTEQNLETIPENVKWSFDKGYYDSLNIKFLEDKKIDAYLPSQVKKNKSPYDKENFTYNKRKDAYVCPEKKLLPFFSEHFDKLKNKTIRKYKGKDCQRCPKQKYCTKTKDGIRIVKMYPYEEERNALDKKMQTPKAKEIYKLRRQIVEPVFGDIKKNKGITTFLTRRLKTVKTEFNLICIANNICRIQNKKQETFITLRNKHENENSETFSSQNKERNCMDINFSVEKSSLSISIF
jgi:transposase